MTNGATSGYVLKSDVSGNATWANPNTIASQNIYNIDGTLTGNRTMTMSGYTLDLSGGNVGINNTNPGYTLAVGGTTSTTNFQMTNGATTGYLLKSDAGGNASWVNPTSVTTATSVSNTISGNTISTTVNGTPGTAVTVPNIYTADGSLTANRTVTMAADNLTFATSTGNLIFNPSSTGAMVVGSGDATSTPVGGILRAPNAGAGNTTGGGSLSINGGFGYGGTSGGSVFVNGGTTSGSGTNGNVYVRGGYTNPNEGAVYLNDDHGGGTFLNAAGGIVTVGRSTAGSAQLTVNNGISVDAAGTNSGSISSLNSATGSNGITFGGSGSGEGIASNRASATAGTNQYGVDLYTNFTRRLSVTNTGGVGINTASLGTGAMLAITNPSATPDAERLSRLSAGYSQLPPILPWICPAHRTSTSGTIWM